MTQAQEPRTQESRAQERGARFGEVFAVGEFRVLFGSFALLIAGDSMKMLALSVLVYARTGSPGLSAAAYMAGWLPYVVGGLFLLSPADRLPPRLLMIAGEVTRLVTCLLIAFAGLPIWAMLALVLAGGLFTPMFMAARSAMLPEILPGDLFVLGRSVLGVTSAGGQVAGMALGGAVIAAAGPEGALACTAALSALSALVLRFGLPYRKARGGAGGTLAVNRRLLADARVRRLLLAQWAPVVFLAGAEAMVVPYLGGQAGLVLGMAAAGMAAGEFAVGRFAAPRLRERLSRPLAVAMGLPWLVFAVRPGLAVAAVCAALSAACLAYTLGLQRAFLEAVPREVRGQAFGLQFTGLMTGQALGAALVGALGEALGPHLAIAAAGAAVMLLAVLTVPRTP
ncbi:MFS transporter [Thermoactinospora rubra]|uniref:MFS transporter n=1 Tax=Thermoactinospora rubra TaxID=1088767 RepID=UPI000A101CFB|nr:MFS transporter [Thermoactinospora rubra]